MKKRAIVTGAGGFIGSHLVRFLKSKGYWVGGIDQKYPEFSQTVADQYTIGDLRDWSFAQTAIDNADELYMLAADMGGVGYINTTGADISSNNILININSLRAAHENAIDQVFFASSACVYPESRQETLDAEGLVESEVFPAQPDTAYGWEKLFTELVCQSYMRDHSLKIKIARFHNIYGPEGTYDGGREKSPAAVCRKIALVKNGGSITIWGDGKQQRSYCYIDDCLDGIWKLMQSSLQIPVNIGSDEMVSLNQLVSVVKKISQKKFSVKHNRSKPQGVRSRNANITLARRKLSWYPKTDLQTGFEKTYSWIAAQLANRSFG